MLHCLSYIVGADKCLLIEMMRSCVVVNRNQRKSFSEYVSQLQLSYAAVTNNPTNISLKKRLTVSCKSAVVLLYIRDAG